MSKIIEKIENKIKNIDVTKFKNSNDFQNYFINIFKQISISDVFEHSKRKNKKKNKRDRDLLDLIEPSNIRKVNFNHTK